MFPANDHSGALENAGGGWSDDVKRQRGAEGDLWLRSTTRPRTPSGAHDITVPTVSPSRGSTAARRSRTHMKCSYTMPLAAGTLGLTLLSTAAFGQAPPVHGVSTTADNQILIELTSDDSAPANPFDLNGRTLIFRPDGFGRYSREVRSLQPVSGGGRDVDRSVYARPRCGSRGRGWSVSGPRRSSIELRSDIVGAGCGVGGRVREYRDGEGRGGRDCNSHGDGDRHRRLQRNRDGCIPPDGEQGGSRSPMTRYCPA